MVTYGILTNSKFSHLCMKHNVCLISTCNRSACIYAFFKITDNFLTYLWSDVSNHMLDCSLELKNPAWFVGIYLGLHKPHKKKSQGIRLQDLGGHSLSPSKDITHSGNFLSSNASVSCEVWQVAPSCCNQKLSISNSFKFGHN